MFAKPTLKSAKKNDLHYIADAELSVTWKNDLEAIVFFLITIEVPVFMKVKCEQKCL